MLSGQGSTLKTIKPRLTVAQIYIVSKEDFIPDRSTREQRLRSLKLILSLTEVRQLKAYLKEEHEFQ